MLLTDVILLILVQDFWMLNCVDGQQMMIHRLPKLDDDVYLSIVFSLNN